MSALSPAPSGAGRCCLLLIVSMIGFAILHLAPGGPLSQFAAGGEMTQADLDRIAEQLGLNRPLPVQYAEWLWRMLRGDWGLSYRDQQPVLHIIGSHVGATLRADADLDPARHADRRLDRHPRRDPALFAVRHRWRRSAR